MRYVHVSASGKINPAIYVGPVRPDGYHSLDIFFESLDIFDEIEVGLVRNGGLTLSVEGEANGVPTDETNLAMRAARLLHNRYGVTDGAEILITKKIPVAAGMAGGSADAAGTLLALSELWELEITHEELMALGAEIGADVPFCLLGSLARAGGIGEELHSIRPGNMHFWVLITFPEGISTAEAYAKLDELRAARGEEASLDAAAKRGDMLEALLGERDTTKLAPVLHNDLTEAALALRPELHEAFEAIGTLGIGAIVCGSGPTIGVLAEDFDTANALSGHLSLALPNARVIRANGPAAGAHVRRVE